MLMLSRPLFAFGASAVVLGLALFFVSLGATPADAQSRQCRALERQLSSLSSGGSRNSSTATRYKRAVRDQQRELGKAKRLARSRGCYAGNQRSGACRARLNLVKRMERNLVSLQKNLRRAEGSTRNSSKRQAIQRQIRRLNCGASLQAVTGGKRSGRRSLVEQIFGVDTVRENSNRRGQDSGATNERIRRGATYRTLCVRKCDGYYFPISFSTTPSYFAGDAEACIQRCPAAETELFVHSMPQGSSENMISHRSNAPYTDQSFAFLYRKEKVENCTCGRASRNQLLALAGGSSSNSDANKIWDVDANGGQGIAGPRNFSFVRPNWRPTNLDSPEMTMNRSGGLSIALASRLITATAEGEQLARSSVADRQVRIVGPKFFPDQ